LAIQETTTFPVKIKEVYYQNWVAGVRGGGSGTNFHIEFEQQLPKDIMLNQLYFRGNKDSVQKNSESLYVVAFKGTANLEKGEELSSDAPPSEVKKIVPPISISDDEAVLEFTQKGKRKLYKIKNVTEKEMLAYPSARPRN
jgi:hypothetical protein